MRIAYAIDTHLQADHHSGGRRLAAETSARYALHESAAVNFAFFPLHDGQDLDLGNVPKEEFVSAVTNNLPPKPAEMEEILRSNRGSA